MASKTDAERQRRMWAKRKTQGLAKICVWVPESDREKLKAYATDLLEQHTKRKS